MARTKIFISYSHEDERWRKRVVGHLEVLAMEGIIDLWDDRKIGVGEDWLERINQQMLNARIALLLVSSAFLTSKFIREQEVPRLFDRHGKGGMVIYPLLLKPCPWQEVPWLAQLQIRPPDARPVASFRGPRADQILVEVTREISAMARAREGNFRESARKPAADVVNVRAATGEPALGVPPATAVHISGLWRANIREYSGPQGLRKGRCIFEFVVSGDRVLGTVRDNGHAWRPISQGTVSGDRISFTTLTEWEKGDPSVIELHGQITGKGIDFAMQTPSWGMYSPWVQQFRATRLPKN